MIAQVGINPKWTGGFIRMEASFKARNNDFDCAYIMQIGMCAVICDVECILQSFMMPTRTWPHLCCGHWLVAQVLRAAASSLHAQQISI